MGMLENHYFCHFAADPYFNMAFDEWMLASAFGKPGIVLLRLYSWREGAITFGCNQRPEGALDFSHVGTTPIIRRITGGRAVYHDVSELTYAIAINPHAPDRQGLSGSVSATHRQLAQGLKSFLQRVGMHVSLVEHSSSENSRREFIHKAPCFASAARYELCTSGRKVVASAQRQIGGVLLQHGSIKISGVAPHPALRHPVDHPRCEPQPLEKKQFVRFAKAFLHEMRGTLGVIIESESSTPGLDAEIKRLARGIVEKPLARRDPVKQTSLPKSL